MWTKENPPAEIVAETWIENEASLKTHEQPRALEALTLDQIYDMAKTVWLKADKKEKKVYFETKNDGIISSAGYIPKGCQDDCFTGIAIKDVKTL